MILTSLILKREINVLHHASIQLTCFVLHFSRQMAPCYLVLCTSKKKTIVQFLISDGQLGKSSKKGIGHNFPKEEVYSTDEKKLFCGCSIRKQHSDGNLFCPRFHSQQFPPLVILQAALPPDVNVQQPFMNFEAIFNVHISF